MTNPNGVSLPITTHEAPCAPGQSHLHLGRRRHYAGGSGKRYYLARDLVQVVDPQTPITQIPFTCSRCGDNDCIDIRFQSNVAILNKSFYLRRLVGIRKMPLWEDQLYDQWDGR